jgi:hypothetical protein
VVGAEPFWCSGGAFQTVIWGGVDIFPTDVLQGVLPQEVLHSFMLNPPQFFSKFLIVLSNLLVLILQCLQIVPQATDLILMRGPFLFVQFPEILPLLINHLLFLEQFVISILQLCVLLVNLTDISLSLYQILLEVLHLFFSSLRCLQF